MSLNLYDTAFIPPDQDRISFSGIGPGITFNWDSVSTLIPQYLGIETAGSTTWDGTFTSRTCSYSDGISGHNIRLRHSQGNKNFRSLYGFDVNSVTGMFYIPQTCGGLITLQLDNNGLTGCSLPSGMSSIQLLTLGSNRISGMLTIPIQYQSLYHCDYSYNLLTGISLPPIGTLRNLLMGGNDFSGIITIPSGCTGLNYVSFGNNRKGLVSPIIQQGANIRESFDIIGSNVTGAMIFPPSVTGIGGIFCGLNNITGMNIPSGSSSIYFYNNKLTSVLGVANCWYFANLILNDNLLSQSAVDGILADSRSTYNNNNRIALLYLHGTNNATPSAAGLADKAFLTGVGWTVKTN